MEVESHHPPSFKQHACHRIEIENLCNIEMLGRLKDLLKENKENIISQTGYSEERKEYKGLQTYV